MDWQQLEEEIANMPPLTKKEVGRITGALRSACKRRGLDVLILWAYTPEQLWSLAPCILFDASPVGEFREVEKRINDQMRKGKLPSPTWLSSLAPSEKLKKLWFSWLRRARRNLYAFFGPHFLTPLRFKFYIWQRFGSTFINKWSSNFCTVVFARPQKLHLQRSSYGMLHCIDGPAFISANGQKSYIIHGRLVPPELFENPEKLSDKQIQQFMRIPNVTIRDAIFEKVGFARLLRAVRAVEVDNWREYTLYMTPVKRNSKHARSALHANCLSMINPTTGRVHFEWVPRHCNTVEAALRFRNGRRGVPIVLT